MEQDLDDLEGWNGVADRYIELIDRGALASSYYLEDFLSRELGPAQGKRYVDVGGGSGWYADELQRRGASAVVVDGSPVMVRVGRERYPRVPFVEHDLRDGLGVEGPFDGAVARFSLHCISDLRALTADLARTLVRGAPFVVCIPHPAFYGTEYDIGEDGSEHLRRVGGYLAHRRRWRTDFGGHHFYHRPISWYVTALTGDGAFHLSSMEEPARSSEVEAEREALAAGGSYESWSSIPVLLGLAFVRT